MESKKKDDEKSQKADTKRARKSAKKQEREAHKSQAAEEKAARKAKKDKAKKDKKERVIHTRVSENLEQELRESAALLGVSVSNLVRNALLNTFGLVEGLVVDGNRVAHSARGEAVPKSPTTDEPGVVIGWQPMILHMNALCARCNAILPKGEEGFVGVLQGSGTKPIRCAACVKEG